MHKKKEFVDNFSEMLVKLKIVNPKEAHAMKKDFHTRSKENFDFFLLDEGLVTKDELLKALSEYYKIPYFDVRGFEFDHDLVVNFPKEFLLENLIIPSQVDQDMLTVVASQPEAPGLEAAIRDYTSNDIVFLVGIGRDIIDVIREFYDESPTYIHDLTDEDEMETKEEREGVDVDQMIEDEEKW